MGGKSRKTGGVSYSLIQRLKANSAMSGVASKNKNESGKKASCGTNHTKSYTRETNANSLPGFFADSE